MNKYIALDTETGGIGEETSLLTAYFSILDENLEQTDELYLELRPADGVYKVKGDAMKINGIDLVKHDESAISYKEGGTKLYDFLSWRKPAKKELDTDKNAGKLIALGQNVKFDILKITNNLIHTDSWHQFVSYRTLDTAVIAGFLIDAGKLPPTINAGLASMAEYFGVGAQSEFDHDARHDTKLTIAVYKKLLEIVKKYDIL